MSFFSQYQIAQFLRNLEKNQYGNIDLTSEKNIKTLKENGFVFGHFSHEEYENLTYTGLEGFTGMDNSMIGATAGSKRARPNLVDIAYPIKLPTFVEEDLAESAYLADRVAQMKVKEAQFIAEGRKYGGWSNFLITSTMNKFFD